ncbi:MAG TPA: TIGR00730 family Rossman fold protein [Afifellaceae bacterium]|nr:TIGR00730 family Rossman fold protein [Afifellaceae bacterium]
MKSICVFCGSNLGARDSYVAAARGLGGLLADRGITLVYGGAAIGLMGAVADGALVAGGRVIGVMPRALFEREIAHPGITELRKVESMHERKALMADLANGFIGLPGGVGTLEELFEMWTWGQLGYHGKPVGLLNVDGYFDALLAFVAHQTQELFMRPAHRDMLLVDGSAERLLERFAGYQPPTVTKWIGKGER